MKIVYSGAEVGSNRTLLEKSNVTLMGLNYWGLRKRGLPKTKTWLISEHFDANTKVIIESGAQQADKSGMSRAELLELAADYQEFLVNNAERASAFVEFDSQVLGKAWIENQRSFFENDPKFWIVWHSDYGLPDLHNYSSAFHNVVIPHETIESVTNLASLTRSYERLYGTRYHALACAKPDNLRQTPFTTASTLSWISPMRRGETIIWDGSKLVRYPKRMKAQARPRYKSLVEKAGLDAIKFMEDDTLEATKVAVWSYQQLEANMDKKRPDLHVIDGEGKKVTDNSDDTLYTGLMEFMGDASDNSDVEVRKVSSEVTPRDPSEMTHLPVFGYQMKTVIDTDENGNDVIKDVPVIQSKSSSLRQCDTCFVAANCPAFKPQNTCAFNLPVEVKTKDQLKALLTAMIEMQGQRVAFMRYSEEINGGYADPNLSQEVDRLFEMVNKMKSLEENREFIRITAERQSSGGVLSAIFGDRAQALRELPNGGLDESQTTKIIHNIVEE